MGYVCVRGGEGSCSQMQSDLIRLLWAEGGSVAAPAGSKPGLIEHSSVHSVGGHLLAVVQLNFPRLH